MPHHLPRFSRKFKIAILPLISAVLMAMYVGMDTYYLNEISSDPYAYSFLSMSIGLITVVIFMFVMRIPLKNSHFIGSYIDPNYHGFLIPKGKLLLLLLIAGLSSAVSTLTYFYLVGVSSPSLILPFSQIVIVYLILYESLTNKEPPTTLEIQSIIIILIGLFLMTSTDLTIDWITILLVLGPYNISIMVFIMALRQAKRMIYRGHKNDSLNLRLWSLAFNTLLMSLLVIPFITPSFYTALSVVDLYVVAFIIIDMLVSTFAYVAYIRALGITKMSTVNAIVSFSVVLGIPVTLIGNFFFPGACGSLSFPPIFWLFKGMGIFLILIGIISITRNQVKTYLLIYLTGSVEPILKQLAQVKGMTSVAAVSGDRLLIATLQFPSLGTAYRSIVTEIERVGGIKKVITLTTLKEWELL
ncbi:MAG: EamA family transporter [Candidatus Helarchaeota archaeon]